MTRRKPPQELTDPVLQMIEDRYYERDPDGHRVIPAWQDPEIDPDPDDYIYD